MKKTRDEVKAWLKFYKVRNCTINDDLTVDVKSNVNLSMRDLGVLPVRFGVVEGSFDCSK